jgi:hypothetical protein
MLPQVLSKVNRWGEIESAVKIIIYRGHEELEDAIGRHGYPWMRAWAQYDALHLQSPRTWGFEDFTAALREVLTHELTHVVFYQNACNKLDWSFKEIPLWYREGMASYTAEQGYRRPGPAELGKFIKEHPEIKILEEGEKYYNRYKEPVYGIAHRAFEFLIQKFGEEAARRINDNLSHAMPFERAFERATGESLIRFYAKVRELILSPSFS